MTQIINGLGQPIGLALPDWRSVERPPKTIMEGRYCRVEPIDLDKHAADLFDANNLAEDGRSWTYLPYGPFETADLYRAWMERACLGDDPLFHAIIDLRVGKAVGVASLMRIDPAMGVIEVGHINYSPHLRRTTAATEAMYLLMRRVFDELGYRRYEWKCNALNDGSICAARRFGFVFEGIFRQAAVSKGRNRDSAWFSIIDKEWPARKAAFEAWLDPSNFDAAGRQRLPLNAAGLS